MVDGRLTPFFLNKASCFGYNWLVGLVLATRHWERNDMQKTELAQGIIQYTFEPLPGKHFGNNIYAVVHGNKVLLIDTGYAFQAQQVLEDIKDCGWEIDSVILSHFHDDHMQGLRVLPKVPVYGSEHYGVTLELWTDEKDRQYFVPSLLIREPYTKDFGQHSVALLPFPGHSMCTILIRINDTYLHVADEVMFSNDGRPILPSADPNQIPRHVESLNRLKAMTSLIFLPAHGPALADRQKMERDIDNRLCYFQTILSSGRALSYEEASKGCDCAYLHSEWHRYVYE